MNVSIDLFLVIWHCQYFSNLVLTYLVFKQDQDLVYWFQEHCWIYFLNIQIWTITITIMIVIYTYLDCCLLAFVFVIVSLEFHRKKGNIILCCVGETIAWKVSKCGVFSGPYFPIFGLIYSVNLRIQSKYRKIWTRKNSVFGHLSRSHLLRR